MAHERSREEAESILSAAETAAIYTAALCNTNEDVERALDRIMLTALNVAFITCIPGQEEVAKRALTERWDILMFATFNGDEKCPG